MTTTKQHARAKVGVTRTSGSGCEATLHFAFDPKTLGEARTTAFWQGIAMAIANILEPSEYADFLAKMEAAKAKAGVA